LDCSADGAPDDCELDDCLPDGSVLGDWVLGGWLLDDCPPAPDGGELDDCALAFSAAMAATAASPPSSAWVV
jgi:hypothetical protein